MTRNLLNETAIILMSTYNGEKFLPDMLESIDRQTAECIVLLVRDDGSNDQTVAIISKFASRSRVEVKVVTGENVGACSSFFSLISQAPRDRILLLADQDDIWHPDKVHRALSALGATSDPVPRLYCSRLNLVDSERAIVGQSPRWPRAPSFENALVENVATGCTVAFNPALRDRFQTGGVPQQAIMHDWWLYLLASAFGEVIYDPEPSIDYRLHGGNAVGLPRNRLGWFLAKVRRRLAGRGVDELVAQACEFRQRFADQLTSEQAAAIARLDGAARSVRDSLAFIAEADIRRQFRSDTIALKALLLATSSGLLSRRNSLD